MEPVHERIIWHAEMEEAVRLVGVEANESVALQDAMIDADESKRGVGLGDEDTDGVGVVGAVEVGVVDEVAETSGCTGVEVGVVLDAKLSVELAGCTMVGVDESAGAAIGVVDGEDCVGLVGVDEGIASEEDGDNTI
jgi:hypothetical protein